MERDNIPMNTTMADFEKPVVEFEETDDEGYFIDLGDATDDDNTDTPIGSRRLQEFRKSGSPTKPTSNEPNPQNPLLGFVAVIIACITSGFAGVYFELQLKRSSSSIWIRNIQLGMFGSLISAITMILCDGTVIRDQGLLVGYNGMTWLVILNQAFGGLVVAVVVKYADNILKGFASSVSIIFSGLLSMVLFDFWPRMEFIVGASLVMTSVYLYGKPDAYQIKNN